MTPAQRMHLDMLVDQVDAEFPADRIHDEERLAKDPHLAILPSGRKLSTRGIRSFEVIDIEATKRLSEGWLPEGFRAGDALIVYRHGGEAFITDRHDLAAFSSALNDIGVYVAAPTLKGDDNDGDGLTAEGSPV